MNQEKIKKVEQIFYNEKWVDKEFFRAFVYNGIEQKLAENYKEYEFLISTGLWFDSKELAKKAKESKEANNFKIEEKTNKNYSSDQVFDFKKIKARKPKYGSNSQTVPN